MAFADPQSVDIGAGAVSLPRVSTSANASTYRSADGLLELVLSNQYGKRTRRTARLTVTKITADPFLPATNVTTKYTTYVVFDIPAAGFTVTEQKNAFVTGLSALLTASSGAKTTQLLGGEN